MGDFDSKHNKPRVVWFNIDALRPDIFFDLLDGGRLPNLAAIFAGGKRSGEAVSVFPTVTMTCQASLATGSMPARHLITGNGWYDRYGKRPTYRDYTETRSALRIYGYEPVGMPTGVLPRRHASHPLADRDLSGATPTLYDAIKTRSVRSAVVFNQISRGANEWVAPDRRDIIHFSLCHNRRLSFKSFERAVAARALHFIKDAKHLHRVVQLYFPGADGFSHRHGPDSQREFLSGTLDPIVGRVLAALSDRHPITEFFFVLSADHGQTTVKTDGAHNVRTEIIMRMLDSIGRPPYVPGDSAGPKPASSVAFTQGGSFFIYLKNMETRNWYDPPRLRADLVDTAAELAEFSRKSFAGLAPGWLDITIVKDHVNERYVVFHDRKVYETAGFFSQPENIDRYPDAARRLRGLFSKRSPDLILLADYSRGFFFGKRGGDPGQHGNLSREDSLTPLMFAGPGISPGQLPSNVSIIDVAPTIAALFDVPFPGAEGKILPLFG